MRTPGALTSLPPLLPAPARARRLAGCFRLRATTPLVLGPASDEADFRSARALAAAVRERSGLDLAIETHARSDALGPHVALSREAERGDRYRLRVRPDGICAVGAGPAGLRYAVETLAQLVGSRGAVPACEIDDAPDFPARGILLDVSRGKVPTLASLRGIVDLCVKLKLNVLMLYTEHTFRFRRHPKIGLGASPLEARSVRELDRYAAERFVELIPCLQSLGHMQRILSIPEYASLAESPAGCTISPLEPGSYALLRDLYDEYLPNFRSHRFNANCDEPWDLERGKSAARARELGPGGVYVEHLQRVRELAAAHGAQTLVWADVVHSHPERIAELPRDLVLLDWGYEADCDTGRARRFADCGLEFWVCPGTASWNALFPRVDTSCTNIARWARAGRRFGAAGLLTTDWGDGGHYNLQGNSWFAFAWSAQQAWSGDAAPGSFDAAFGARLFGDRSGEIARLYRALGRIHDPGFATPNGSPLQHLFFDDVDRGAFIARAVHPALRRCERALLRVGNRLADARHRFARDALTARELAYAVNASLVAVRRAGAAKRYRAWRDGTDSLAPRARRALVQELRDLAREQAALVPQLRRLWLARSAISDFDSTRRRIARAAAGLRRAATRVSRGSAQRE